MTPDRNLTLGRLLRHAPARAVFGRVIPALADSPFLEMARTIRLADLPERMGVEASLVDELIAALPDIPSIEERDTAVAARADYEAPDVPTGSAQATVPSVTSKWGVHEVTIVGPSHGNPFVDVDLRATYVHGDVSFDVQGFYDGDGVYRIRFMPEVEGEWSFTTRSTARSLDGITGSFTCAPAAEGSHGPVRVSHRFHFAHADGTPFRPIGTTAYAWNHQSTALEEQTLTTLATAPFNKVRMCVFPKWYPFNQVEPEHHAYERRDDGTFDLQCFNPVFFRHLEWRIADLAALGIEADLILFHPYDKWGYSDMPASADDRYLRYVIARLAAFSNVWWSLANEYDFVFDKCLDDWERIGRVIAAADPHDHLIGVHNGLELYDHTKEWVTHSSIQSQGVDSQPEACDAMRERWGKPVSIDECCYEGDIEYGFGNLTAEGMVRRFWDGTVRGGYVTHGECFFEPDDVLWWAKGGVLHGDSAPRIAFLREILEDAPWPLEPFSSRRGYPWVGHDDRYFLTYNGDRRPARRTLDLPAGGRYRIDVIDTWNMTVETLAGDVGPNEEVHVPARPYIALRAVRIDT